jgi:hypothetical protein
MIVAFFAIALGAALIAFLTFHAVFYVAPGLASGDFAAGSGFVGVVWPCKA